MSPPRGDKPVVIYFHGNAEIVAWRAERHRALIADGTGLIALSYRGYGGSTGTPTEDGLHRDAEAAYAFAVARYAPERIVLWGHSLGTGVAVQARGREAGRQADPGGALHVDGRRRGRLVSRSCRCAG